MRGLTGGSWAASRSQEQLPVDGQQEQGASVPRPQEPNPANNPGGSGALLLQGWRQLLDFRPVGRGEETHSATAAL